MQLEVSI